jgi:hypothetical protein
VDAQQRVSVGAEQPADRFGLPAHRPQGAVKVSSPRLAVGAARLYLEAEIRQLTCRPCDRVRTATCRGRGSGPVHTRLARNLAATLEERIAFWNPTAETPISRRGTTATVFGSADRPMDRRGNSPGRVGSADGPPGHDRNGRVARRGFGAWNG